jgi:hypothetical protein
MVKKTHFPFRRNFLTPGATPSGVLRKLTNGLVPMKKKITRTIKRPTTNQNRHLLNQYKNLILRGTNNNRRAYNITIAIPRKLMTTKQLQNYGYSRGWNMYRI